MPENLLPTPSSQLPPQTGLQDSASISQCTDPGVPGNANTSITPSSKKTQHTTSQNIATLNTTTILRKHTTRTCRNLKDVNSPHPPLGSKNGKTISTCFATLQETEPTTASSKEWSCRRAQNETRQDLAHSFENAMLCCVCYTFPK